MNQFKRVFSLVLAAAVLIGAMAIGLPNSVSAAGNGILEAKGHLESAYVEWDFISGASGYNVYVQASGASGWDQLDSMLIREYPDRMRADAVGLKAGSYVMKIVPLINGSEQESQALTTGKLTVEAHDRSGYGFSSASTYKTASGAYNDDGTLKSNAQVIYVTADTAKTCTATINGVQYTGFQTILDGKQKQGTADPLCFRIIGLVTLSDLDHISSSSEGIQIKGKSNYNEMNITIEGIGEDATVSGFGFLIRNCGNVEMRNLGILNFMDDGVSVDTNNCNLWIHNCDFFYGGEGGDADQAKGDGSLDTKKSQYITYSYNHFWDAGKVHLVGNGSSDSVNYLTFHHNWYDHSDSRHPRVRSGTVHIYNNFYDGVSKYGAGATLDADIFSECNYFLNTKYPLLISEQGSDIYDPLTGAYDGEGTFSGEAGGMIKSYGDVMDNVTRFVPYSENSTHFDAYVATSRNETVPSSVKAYSGGAGYSNFDTASNFYSYEVETAEEAMATVQAYAGRINQGDFQWEFTDADNTDYDVNSALKSAIVNYKSTVVAIGGNSVDTGSSGGGTDATEPSEDPSEGTTTPGGGSTDTTVPAGSYVHNFTTDGKTSSFYTIAGSTSGSKGDVSYAGLTLSTCLKMSSSASVAFTAPADGTFTMVFNSSCAGYTIYINGGNSTAIPSDGIITLDVTAGTSYTITKNKSESFLYYLVYTPNSTGEEEHTHSYSAVVTAPTCTAQGFTTYTCTCGDSYVADYVAATGHSYSSSVTTQPGCETTGVRTYTCANCGDSYTESIPATGHSYNAVVTAPTCTVNGYTTYTCSTCGSSYVGDEVAATGHSYKDGYCTVCGAEDPNYVALFDLYGSNVNLGNDLTMNFYVQVSDINGEAYYIEIVKEYDDGSTVTTTVPYAEWESYYGVMWKVSLKGMAAKEMADKIYVTVYTTAGVQVSNTWTDSIRDYCIRQLNNASQSGAYTLLADMLNYGAAAQTQFGYNTDDLANSTMTAAQKAYATQSFNLSDYENNQVKGTNYIGSSLSLETNIQLTIYFNKLTSSNGLKAVVSYTDHLGVMQSYEVAESEFTTLAGIYYGIVVDTLVAADVCQVVSVALYDGSTLVGSASDSMESYAVRQGGDMNIALMKFTLSAYEFLH